MPTNAVLSVQIFAACFYYRQWINFVSVFAARGLMLIAEMLNTAVEALCDFVEAAHNDKIRIIKDISATGIAILIWISVIAVELNMLWQAFN